MKEKLMVGMKVEIGIQRAEENLNFLTKIEEIKENSLILGMPIYKGNYFFINLLEEITIYYSVNDLFYFLKGKVIDKSYIPLPVIEVEILEGPKRIQRRSFFRIPVTLKIKVKNTNSINWCVAYIKNISGGGALLHTYLECNKNDILELRIPVDKETLEVKARVVRVEKDIMRYINPFEIAVEYYDISEKDRDKIIKFIMQEQRKLRKKGYF